MTLYLIRDDDSNATTDPMRLERGYLPLLDAGLPISFSVVPEVRLDTLAPGGRREEFLSPSTPASSACARLERETPLAEWLRAHRDQAGVMMHGLSHERRREGTEFGALSRSEAMRLIVRGLDVLERALDVCPRGFVAPWDAFSRESLGAATSAFDFVSTGYVDRIRLGPAYWASHLVERVSRSGVVAAGRGWIVRHPGCVFTADTRPADVGGILSRISADALICVIVLHHWMFWGEGAPHPVIAELAQRLRGKDVCGVDRAIEELDALPSGWALREAAGRAVQRACGGISCRFGEGEGGGARDFSGGRA